MKRLLHSCGYLIALSHLVLPASGQQYPNDDLFPVGAYWVMNPQSSGAFLQHAAQMDSIGINFWWGVMDDNFRPGIESAALSQGASLAAPYRNDDLGYPSLDHLTRVYSIEMHAEDPKATCQPGIVGDWPCHNPNRVGRVASDLDATRPLTLPLSEGATHYRGNALVAEPSEGAGQFIRNTHRWPAWVGEGDGGIAGVPGLQLNARIRLRVETGGVYPPANTEVVKVTITHGSSVTTKTIFFSDLAGQSYEEIKFPFNLDLPDHVRFDVWYPGHLRTYVDYYGFESLFADDFFSGNYDFRIRDIASWYSGDAYSRMAINDEPWEYEDRSAAYVDSVLRAIGSSPSFQAVGGEHDLRRLEYHVLVADPRELVIDYYPFGKTSVFDRILPLPDLPQGGYGIPPYDVSTYNDELQARLNELTSRLNNAKIVSQYYDKNFWYILSSSGLFDESINEYHTYRPPSIYEMRATAFLGLAYGAKGLLYFLYYSVPGYVGLVDRNYDHSSDVDVNLGGAWTGYATRWEGARQLNNRVHRLIPTLRQLRSEYTYPVEQAPPAGSFVRSVKEVSQWQLPRPAQDAEVGTFTHDINSYSYFMIVNKRCRSTDSRTFEIEIEPSPFEREVVVVESGKIIKLMPNQNTFVINVEPGDGHLFYVRYPISILGRNANLNSEISYESKIDDLTMPEQSRLHPVYPNPLENIARIKFDLAEGDHINISIYDMGGREVARVADGKWEAGYHHIDFDASSLPSGIYVCRLATSQFMQGRPMVLVK